MKKIMIFISCLASIILINRAISAKAEFSSLKDEKTLLQADNLDMKKKIGEKTFLPKRKGVLLTAEYGWFINQIRALEAYSGTNMDVQLEEKKDIDDISAQFVPTSYRGVRGLMVRIMVNKFSKETDMGAVLDDIHLLEKNTDFMTSEIVKDNNNLIVKGEVYGI